MTERWSGRLSEEETLGRELNEAKTHSKTTPGLGFKNGSKQDMIHL